MSSYTELPYSQLLGKFASGDPAPGGGSASALAGSVAAALVSMVCRLTIGKKGYEEVEREATTYLTIAQGLADRLSASIEGDAVSFEGVMQAMALPKDTDEQKAARRDAMQAAFKGATLAPISVAQGCLEAGQLALKLVSVGNQNASTDAGVAVLMAVAGGEGALFNAEINLGSIKDEAWVAARRDEVAPLWVQLAQLRTDLWPAMAKAGVSVPR